MKKIPLALVLGTVLGLADGLLTFFDPAAVQAGMMPAIITGSTAKGLITGLVIGLVTRRRGSLSLGVLAGLGVGLFLSWLAALPADPNGDHHYLEIMLPGAVLGIVVGYVAQRYGKGPEVAS